MASIIDASPEPWRRELLPARFRTAQFHVESGGRLSGRRIALHEYPKRDLPYAEDMGRRTIVYDIAGYFIEGDRGPGYNWDYRIPRNRLIDALETEGPGTLVHPTLGSLQVACERYSIEESRQRGGFCVFQMRFIEYGSPGNKLSKTNTTSAVNNAASTANAQASTSFANAMTVFNATGPLRGSPRAPVPPLQTRINPLLRLFERL